MPASVGQPACANASHASASVSARFFCAIRWWRKGSCKLPPPSRTKRCWRLAQAAGRLRPFCYNVGARSTPSSSMPATSSGCTGALPGAPGCNSFTPTPALTITGSSPSPWWWSPTSLIAWACPFCSACCTSASACRAWWSCCSAKWRPASWPPRAAAPMGPSRWSFSTIRP